MATLRELFEKGKRRVCIGCNTTFEVAPKAPIDDGHGGREIEMCRCGSDLIGYIIEQDGKLFICRRPEVEANSILIEQP